MDKVVSLLLKEHAHQDIISMDLNVSEVPQPLVLVVISYKETIVSPANPLLAHLDFYSMEINVSNKLNKYVLKTTDIMVWLVFKQVIQCAQVDI